MPLAQCRDGQVAAYNSTLPTLVDGNGACLQVDANGKLLVSAAISTGDIEIGQVELKDSDSTAQANIKAANTSRSTATVVLAVQHVDAAGNVLSATPVLGAGTSLIGYVAPGIRADYFNGTGTSANASSTPLTIKAKTDSKKIYVTDIVISVDTAMNVQLQDDTGTPVVLMEQIYLPANSVWSKHFTVPLVVDTNKNLNALTSVSGNISAFASGWVA